MTRGRIYEQVAGDNNPAQTNLSKKEECTERPYINGGRTEMIKHWEYTEWYSFRGHSNCNQELSSVPLLNFSLYVGLINS